MDRTLLLKLYSAPNPKDKKIFLKFRGFFAYGAGLGLACSGLTWSNDFGGGEMQLGNFSTIYSYAFWVGIVLSIAVLLPYEALAARFELGLEGEEGGRGGPSLSQISLEGVSLDGSELGGDRRGVGAFDELYGQIFRTRK